MPRLKHLIFVPSGGLGNRLRAIACARRVAEACGARCTIAWNWGRYDRFFARPAGVDAAAPDWQVPDNYLVIRQLRAKLGGTYANRLVPVDAAEGLVVYSAWLFGYEGEPAAVTEFDLRPWLLQPSPEVRDRVADFIGKYFRRTVGLHVRTTDNKSAQRTAPAWLAAEEARALIQSGHTVFFATDSREVESDFVRRFQPDLFSFGKGDGWTIRWPRTEHLEDEVLKDLVDLFLLAGGEFVVGASASSFSRVAALYNGSPRCRLLCLKKKGAGSAGPAAPGREG